MRAFRSSVTILVASVLPLASAAPQSIDLPSNLLSATPVCLQNCLLQFAAAASSCGTRPSLGCLCSGTNGEYTLGEFALICLVQYCPRTTGSDSALQRQVGTVCEGQPGALQATHASLVITAIVSPTAGAPTAMTTFSSMTPDITKDSGSVPTGASPPSSPTFSPPSSSPSSTPSSAPSSSSMSVPIIGSTPAQTPTPSPPSSTVSPTGSTAAMQSSSAAPAATPKISNGGIAGIVGGSVLGVCLLVGSILLWMYTRRRRQDKHDSDDQQPMTQPKARLSASSDRSLTSFSQPREQFDFQESHPPPPAVPTPSTLRHTLWPPYSEPANGSIGRALEPVTPVSPESHAGQSRAVSALLPDKLGIIPPVPALSQQRGYGAASSPRDNTYRGITPTSPSKSIGLLGAGATLGSHSPKVPPKDGMYIPAGGKTGETPTSARVPSQVLISSTGHESYFSAPLVASRSVTRADLPPIVTGPAAAAAAATTRTRSQPRNYSRAPSVHRANTNASSAYSQATDEDIEERMPAMPAPLQIRQSQLPASTQRRASGPRLQARALAPVAQTYSQASDSSTNSHPYAPHPSPALHPPAGYAPSQPQYHTYKPYSPDVGGSSTQTPRHLQPEIRHSAMSTHTIIEEGGTVDSTTAPITRKPVGKVSYPTIPPSGSPPQSVWKQPDNASSEAAAANPGARSAWNRSAERLAVKAEHYYGHHPVQSI